MLVALLIVLGVNLVFEFAVDGAKIEVAARPEPRSLVTLPLTTGSLTR